MRKRLITAKAATYFFAFGLAIVFVLPVCAQKTVEPTATPAAKDILPTADVTITANVTASELKFETVPNPTVEFPGKPERLTVWEADRQNLPKPVEPGVTYRNIGIQLRIASRFADIDRIVAEALGEIPVSDENSPANQPPTNAPAQNPNLNNPVVPVINQSPTARNFQINRRPRTSPMKKR